MNSTEWEYYSSSDQDTVRLGCRVGQVLRAGDVLALIGELGSGKTCFTRGVAYGLGVGTETVITSPSFSLANEYRGRYPLAHMDLYRLEGGEDSFFMGLDEYLDGERVVVVEWAERCPEMMPAKTLTVRLMIHDESTRIIRFSGYKQRAVEIIHIISRGGEQG